MIALAQSLAWILSFVLSMYAFYFTAVSLFSLFPQKDRQKFPPSRRLAAVIAARNEERVIGNLIDSLQNQNYPKSLYEIIVIPNNCTDETRSVALSKGARVFDCQWPVRSKGDALREFFASILAEEQEDNQFDGFCIFDADNVVTSSFLAEMNNAMCRGVQIGQGYRESKNPYDSFISSCYSIYYYMVNRFHNQARSALGLSTMVNGSGFLITTDLLRRRGGWKTETLTEDIEFSTQCVLAGEKVEWIPRAMFYDEQPVTFEQSWKQRKRWSTGILQGMELYAVPLLKSAWKKKSLACLDFTLFFLAPFMQVFYLASILVTIALNLYYLKYQLFPQTDLFYRMFLTLDFSYLAGVLTAAAVVILERKKIARFWKGILTYWFFLLSWIPINLLCIYKKQTEWTPIQHTRDLKITDLLTEK